MEGDTDMTVRDRWKKGFTLMELLAVVAIIGILCALTAVGVVAYNRSLKVMELNNTAEEIYIAAQNHLTALRTNAASEEALEKAGYGTKVSTVSSNRPADLTATDADAQWAAMYAFGMPAEGSAASGSTVSGGASGGTAGGASGAASGGTAGAAGSASGTTGSTAGVSGGTAPSYAQIAAYVLPAGAVDGTVAGEGNSYIVEYNPSTYTIYGVFYADGKSSVLGRDTGETISVSDLGKLNEEVKADGSTKITSFKPQNGSAGICVGYYGGSSAAGVESHKLNGSIRVKLVNAEKLYAEITTKDLAVNGASAADNAKKNIRLWITVTGKTSGAVKSYGCSINAAGDTDSQKTDSAWKEQGELVKGASGITRQIVLDDLTTSGCHFAEIFGNGKSDNGLNFIPGEDVSVSAAAEITGSLSNIVYSDNTQTTNSLFASLAGSANGKTTSGVSGSASSGVSGSGTTSGGSSVTVPGKVTETVTVMNFRHLENLSPAISHVLGMTAADDTDNAVSLTQISEDAAKKNTYQTGRYSFLAVLGKNLTGESTSKSDSSRSWKGFLDQICVLNGKDASKEASRVAVYFCSQPASGTSTAGGTASHAAAGSYAPVSNDYLSGFDGQNHVIEGVVISDDSANTPGARGLFSIVSPVKSCTLQNVTLRNFDIMAASESNPEEVENVKSGKSSAANKIIPVGSLAGLIAPQAATKVSVNNVTALEKNSSTCGIWGSNETGYATVCGGLIGEIYTNDKSASVSVDKSSASVYVKGKAAGSTMTFSQMDIAGGLVGVISNVKGTVSVTNSYAGGHTQDAQKAPYYAQKNKIRGKADAGWNVTAGNSAGGLIGGIYTSNTNTNEISISSVYSTASAACVGSNGLPIDESDAGGLIGYISSNTYNTDILRVSNSYSTGLLEGTYKGGIAGYIALAGNKNITSELSDSEINDALLRIFQNCAWLKGVNIDDLPCTTVLRLRTDTGHKIKTVKSAESATSGGMVQKTAADLQDLTNTDGTATPYDTAKLNKTYLFRLVTGHHYGDWPIVVTSSVSSSGNRNMIEIDTDSNLVAVLITGLQSGDHKYLVFNNKAVAADPLLVSDSLDKIITGWDSSGRPQTINNATDVNEWQKLLQVTTNTDGTYHYSFSLDNLTQSSGFSFYQLAGEDFYYGENLDIRIMTHVTRTTDPMRRSDCDDIDDKGNKDLIVNSLFETIFTTETLSQNGATGTDGSINLSTQVIQDNINHLNFQNGKDLPDDILKKGGNTWVANFTPRTSATKQYTAVIKNCRQLENLSDDISHVDRGNNLNQFVLTNAVQGCDIVWKALWTSGTSPYHNDYEAYVSELNRKNNGNATIYRSGVPGTYNGYFLPIHLTQPGWSDNQQTSGSHLTSYDGGGHTIAGMDVTTLYADAQALRYGLFGLIDSSSAGTFTIRNLTLEDPRVAGANQAGYLIGHSDRALNLENDHVTFRYLSDPTLENAQDCGGFVGETTRAVSVSNCSIVADTLTISSKNSEGCCVGGLIGKADYSVAINGSYIRCTNALTVRNGGYTGGLVAGGTQTWDLSISDSYVVAPELTIYSTAGDAFSGGIAASGSGSLTTIDKSYVESDQANINSNGTGRGGNTGGIIGACTSDSVIITNCHFSGQTALAMTDGGSAQSVVGGIAGKIVRASSLKISNCYTSAYVYGGKAQAAGGLVGLLSTSASGDIYSEISDCYVSGRTIGDYYPETVTMPQNQSELAGSTMMNITGGTSAGGLIGFLSGGNVRITQTFSCASVYTTSTDQNNPGRTGGIIGNCLGGTNDKLDLYSVYATGLVKTAVPNTVKGTMIGSVSDAAGLSVTGNSAYALSGINDESVAAVGNNSQAAGLFRSVPYNDLKRTGDSQVATNTYDAALKDATGNSAAYAYFIWTTGYSHDGGISVNYYYDGDWINFEGGTEVTGVTVTPSSLNLITGATGNVTAKCNPRSAAGQPVTWASSDPAVATVDDAGKVTGVAVGTAIITATAGNDITGSCTVTVSDAPEWTKNAFMTLNGKAVKDGSTQYILSDNNLRLAVTGVSDARVSWNFTTPVNSWPGEPSGIYISPTSTQATATIEKDGVSVTRSVKLIALPKIAVDGRFDDWADYPALTMNGTALPENDTRVLKACVSSQQLSLYLSDSGTTPFGNTLDNGSHVLYLKIGTAQVVVKIDKDKNVSVSYLSNNQNDYWTLDDVKALNSASGNGIQMECSIYLPNLADSSASSISLQTYGSLSENDAFVYTLTDLLRF